jgi:dihydrofolate reductase
MKAVFAVNAADGFGNGSALPWPRNARDLTRFRQLTVQRSVVMGRGTWLSDMPKPLPQRRNIVLSKKMSDDRCEVFGDVATLLANVGEQEEVCVIGGAQTLWALRPHIQEVYLTRFRSAESAAVELNTKRYLTDFALVSCEDCGDHAFEIYRRAECAGISPPAQ